MGLHLCPIEPDDWSNGPSGGDENCEKCGGSGVVMFEPCEPELMYANLPILISPDDLFDWAGEPKA